MKYHYHHGLGEIFKEEELKIGEERFPFLFECTFIRKVEHKSFQPKSCFERLFIFKHEANFNPFEFSTTFNALISDFYYKEKDGNIVSAKVIYPMNYERFLSSHSGSSNLFIYQMETNESDGTVGPTGCSTRMTANRDLKIFDTKTLTSQLGQSILIDEGELISVKIGEERLIPLLCFPDNSNLFVPYFSYGITNDSDYQITYKNLFEGAIFHFLDMPEIDIKHNVLSHRDFIIKY